MAKERYLILMVGCIEPSVYGPYANEGSRTRAVKKIHRETMRYEDSIFALDMFPVRAWTYSAGFFERGSKE